MGAATQQDSNSDKYMNIGKGITNTCHESYIRTATHLGPEAFRFVFNNECNSNPQLINSLRFIYFRFNDGVEAKALRAQEKYYILRPETFESYFVLWRLTHDQKYRDWAWDAVQAIERYCRSSGGFSGIKNVYLEDPQKDDVQQSFFIAEVLKVSCPSSSKLKKISNN